MAAYPEYLYIAVLGIIFGFVNAMAMGTNDEVFASSVASGAVTFGQAIIICGIFEFLGAVLLGSRVTSTIRGGIADPAYYEDNPTVLMFGNLCALIVSTFMLIAATHYQLPVSTTHTIVACLIGFSLAAAGPESIIWKKVGFVFLAWVVSPLFAGILSFIFFKLVKKFVLQSEHVFHRACQCYPIVVFAGMTLNLFFILLNINKNFTIPKYGLKVVLPGALGGGIVCALAVKFFFVPWIKTRLGEDDIPGIDGLHAKEGAGEDDFVEYSVDDFDDKDPNSAIVKKPASTEPALKTVEDVPDEDHDHKGDGEVEEAPPKQRSSNPFVAAWDILADNTYRIDIKGKSFHENKLAEALWARMEVKDIKTERLFAYLQVFTAILASFAHGSNDVSHSIGPLSSILDIYQNGEFNTKAQEEIWMLALGGFGIALGFGLYGYKIIQALGFKLVALSPSRGFCMEMAAAFTVSIATYMKMPVSSTQCLVGATIGVGIADNGKMGVQWWFFARVILGWVGIFFFALGINAGFFSFSAYSPKA